MLKKNQKMKKIKDISGGILAASSCPHSPYYYHNYNNNYFFNNTETAKDFYLQFLQQIRREYDYFVLDFHK